MTIDIYWLSLFFIFGTVLGSFYNVVGLRLPKKIPFIHDRSHCTTCQQQLSWIELIPLISYIIQRARCRHCQEKISILYPMVELVTGLLFAFSYFYFGSQLELITSLLLISMLVIIFVTDIHYMLIPNKILLFFLPFFIVLRILLPLDPWYDALIGGVVGYGLLAVIIIVSKGGMGAGDMKLFGVLGIILGWKHILLTFFLAALFGALFGALLMALNRVKKRQAIPFGPYIALAVIVTYFYGDKFITFYMKLL